ncbi:MAG: PTS sugar transporter subunit IIA [Candidatus Competibacterales bacterium]
MDITRLVTAERVLACSDIASKKRLLERLAELIVSDSVRLEQRAVFERLIWRERLGSTGLGRGVALPHGKLPGLHQALGALVKLDKGVDFDALDQKPVDLIFALIVPEHFTDEHLKILAHLAELFSDVQLCADLRAAPDSAALFQRLLAWSGDGPARRAVAPKAQSS